MSKANRSSVKGSGLKLFIVLLGISTCFFVASAVGLYFDGADRREASATGKHKLLFFEEKLFFSGASEAEKKVDKTTPNGIAGGVVPHHMLPSTMLSEFFLQLKTQNPKRIILVGPNHHELGANSISSRYAWQTPFGDVEPDLDVIAALLNNNFVYIDEQVIEDEHSVASVMPYIKFYLPDAKVVPIIVRAVMTEAESKALAYQLVEYMDSDTVLISAVDFSHYLNAFEAEQKDEASYTAMKDFDYTKIMGFNNDHTCSPQSIVILLYAMQILRKTRLNLLEHTNSGFLENNLYMETTSYFTMMFN